MKYTTFLTFLQRTYRLSKNFRKKGLFIFLNVKKYYVFYKLNRIVNYIYPFKLIVLAKKLKKFQKYINTTKKFKYIFPKTKLWLESKKVNKNCNLMIDKFTKKGFEKNVTLWCIFIDFIGDLIFFFFFVDIILYYYSMIIKDVPYILINFPEPATANMEGITNIHNHVMQYLFFILIFVIMLLLMTIRKFKTKKHIATCLKVKAPFLETLWTVIPFLLIIKISIPSIALLYAFDEIVEPYLTIKIIGKQWYWSYEMSKMQENLQDINYDSYLIPTDLLKSNNVRLLSVDKPLYLLAEKPLRLVITSNDVIHSWTVPSFGIKVDAIPGRLNVTYLYISRVGIFYGQCSELCGVNHGFMPIEVHVLNSFKELLTKVQKLND